MACRGPSSPNSTRCLHRVESLKLVKPVAEEVESTKTGNPAAVVTALDAASSLTVGRMDSKPLSSYPDRPVGELELYSGQE